MNQYAAIALARGECPLCSGKVYRCEAEHTDDLGPRYHCRLASLHNFLPNGDPA